MKCLLITMTILISSIESTEHRSRHSETFLSREELDDRTKAWLLMVESGKVDEEQLRKITPKSVFISPFLSGRSGKCKEGYRHNHLGECVEVIKVDPNVQLELLLQRLSAMHAENIPQDEEERIPPEMSNGPLHFSIPISISDTTPKDNIRNDIPEMIPVPLPMLSNSSKNATNKTQEVSESSGFGALESVDGIEGSGFESSGYGSGSGDSAFEDNTSTIGLISDELEYTEYTESTTTEIPTTELPHTSSYQSPNLVLDSSNSSMYNDSIWSGENLVNETEEADSIDETIDAGGFINDTNRNENFEGEEVTTEKTDEPQNNTGQVVNETVSAENVVIEKIQNSEPLKKTNLNLIRFPDSSEEVRTQFDVSAPEVFLRFPEQDNSHFSSQQQQPTPSWSSEVHLPSTISRQEFWWLPDNYKIDKRQHRPTLVKFWSRLPLIHDARFTSQVRDPYRKPFYPSQQQNDFFRPSTRISNDYTVGLNPPPPPPTYSNRRGRFYRSESSEEENSTSKSM